MKLLLMGIVLFGFAVSSRADVIDFETGSLFLDTGQTGSLEGYMFTAGGQASGFVDVPITAGSNCTPPCISDGTNALGAFNDANVTIAPNGGGTFSLSAFDVAGTFTGSSRNATSVEVIGDVSGGGQVIDTFTIDPDAFQTLSLTPDFTDLIDAEFLGLTPSGPNSPEFQLDNIVVSASAVPEPTSVILLGTLVLFLGRPRLFRRLTVRPRL